MDLVIWLAFLGGCGAWFWWCARLAKRHPLLAAKPDLVSARARLVADHRQRVSGAHVSAVRHRDTGLVWSAEQRHAVAESKKRR